MSDYTKGHLRLVRRDDHEFEGAVVLRDDGYLIADCNVFSLDKGSPNEEECAANARRLVACWNACDGLTTEDLEGGILARVANKAARLIVRLPVEKQELVEALRGMVELIDHLHAYPKANPRKFFFLRDGGEHGNIHASRAALAKLSPKVPA